MANFSMLTRRQITHLCERIRSGESLTNHHAQQLAVVLGALGSAVGVMSWAESRYEFDPERREVIDSAFTAVALEFAVLVQAVAR